MRRHAPPPSSLRSSSTSRPWRKPWALLTIQIAYAQCAFYGSRFFDGASTAGEPHRFAGADGPRRRVHRSRLTLRAWLHEARVLRTRDPHSSGRRQHEAANLAESSWGGWNNPPRASRKWRSSVSWRVSPNPPAVRENQARQELADHALQRLLGSPASPARASYGSSSFSDCAVALEAL